MDHVRTRPLIRWLPALALVTATACAGAPTRPATPDTPARGAAAAPDTALSTAGRADTGTAGATDAGEAVEGAGEGDAGTVGADADARDAEEAYPTYPAPDAPEVKQPARPPVPVLPGALLPATRIVAFYGNPASRSMGILGELPPDEMLGRLDAEVSAWRHADPARPVRPALQMITVMATGDPGRDSLFRLRMPDWRIREVASWAERRNALLFLDIQPGRSSVPAELEPLRKWLSRPDVHLALDPEWAMPPDGIPGRQIGSMTADDINYAIDFLARLVDRYNLPPKVLVVHRFTASMVRGATEIHRDPRVQVVLNMDGWGAPPQKRAAYRDIVAPEADQFTGFKLFFHNDRRDGSPLLTPGEILQLDPPPLYIQYQ